MVLLFLLPNLGIVLLFHLPNLGIVVVSRIVRIVVQILLRYHLGLRVLGRIIWGWGAIAEGSSVGIGVIFVAVDVIVIYRLCLADYYRETQQLNGKRVKLVSEMNSAISEVRRT